MRARDCLLSTSSAPKVVAVIPKESFFAAYARKSADSHVKKEDRADWVGIFDKQTQCTQKGNGTYYGLVTNTVHPSLFARVATLSNTDPATLFVLTEKFGRDRESYAFYHKEQEQPQYGSSAQAYTGASHIDQDISW